MAKIRTTCDGCGELLRKADTWITMEEKPQKLCTSCWYKWAGLNNPKEKVKDEIQD